MQAVYIRSQDNRSVKGFSSPVYHVPTHRIIKICKGEGVYRFADKELKVSQGMIFIKSPGERLIEFDEQEVQLQVINFTAPDHWISEAYVLFMKEGRQYRFLSEIIGEMIHGRNDLNRKNVLLNLALELFIESGEIKDDGNKVIQDIAKYITANPHLSYTVSELATKCGCSDSHFRAIFRKEMNISPKSFIKKVKMDYAVHLMRDENMLVKQVADILGYNDIYEFSKQFKTVFGKPPTKLVKKNQ